MSDKTKKRNRKKFKDTAVGTFLLKKIPAIVGSLGEILPDNGVLGVVKNIIATTQELSEADREMAYRLLEVDLIEMQEITKRLETDNEHIVTRLVRPVSYGTMFVFFFALVFFDGNVGGFEVNEMYVPVIQALFSTMTMFYFGSRGIEKIMKIIHRYKK